MDHSAECFRRYLDGDESGFDDLIAELRDSITFFIQRIVGDAVAAEDLCIDTFMELLLHKRRYNFKIPLKNYLFMVARSRAIDHLRRIRRYTIVELSDAEKETADDQTPEEIVLKNERAHSLHNAMKTLPSDMQIALHLVYFEGLSYQDAAKVMKKKPKQIDNLLSRSKTELRTILEKEGDLFHETN